LTDEIKVFEENLSQCHFVRERETVSTVKEQAKMKIHATSEKEHRFVRWFPGFGHSSS
jgi:hypothetical protein